MKKKKLSGRSFSESWNLTGGKVAIIGIVEKRDQSGVEQSVTTRQTPKEDIERAS